ncbi:MAG: KEOPS complex subunit Cgi121 [Candidatus Methanofastidiosia archaeon]
MEVHFITAKDLKKLDLNNKKEDIAIFNPDYTSSKEQALLAAKLTIMAFKNGQNIAKRLPIEFLIRISGEKQISKALKFGYDKVGNIAGVVFFKGSLPKDITETGFKKNEEKIRELYQIEGDDLEKGIFEKMALVDV